jgi:hypothetical protein
MEQKTLKGKAKFLGWGNTEEADGVFVSITRCLLDGCRLVVQTNASVSYAYSDRLKKVAENYGVGLRLIGVYELNDYDIEAIFEPVPDALPRFVHVNRGKQMSPANAYILATDFIGEFWISLYREDPDGNRIFLWGDDFIIK